VPVVTEHQEARNSAAAEPLNRLGDLQAVRTQVWLVRWGDTVIKACRLTYGVCDRQTLNNVFAYNARIGAKGLIRQGQVLVMPERVGAQQPN
jgi:hypothetical protein